MQKRYPALHIISLLFKVLAVVVIVVGIILIIVVLSQGGAMSVTFFPEVFGSSLLTLGVVPIILFSLVAALILWGIAEILVCVVDIENNTREMATRESQPKEIPPCTGRYHPACRNTRCSNPLHQLTHRQSAMR